SRRARRYKRSRPFVLITNGLVYVGENKTPTRRCQTGRYEVTTTAEQAVRDGDLCWNHADGPDIVRRRAEARSAAGSCRKSAAGPRADSGRSARRATTGR